MKIDPASHKPVFEQIADGLRSSIAAGTHRPGEPIPSVRALATSLLINPNTIGRAYELLEREGLIESRKGVGMFVTDRAAEIAGMRTDRAVRAAFSNGIQLGQASHMSRMQIDEAYRRAWQGGDGSKR